MDPTPMPQAPGQTGLSLKAKIIILLVAILAVILVTLVVADKQKNEEAAMGVKDQLASQAANRAAQSELQPVQKTSNVDAVVDGIAADYAADAAIAAEGDADVQYVNDSTSLINSTGVYNANEF